MKQLGKATLYRLSKSMGVKIAFGLIWIAAALYFILADQIAKGGLSQAQAGNVTGLGDSMIIWLFGSLLIGLLIGSDFENKTIHGAIFFGREKIIANYMVVFVLLVAVMVLPYTIGSILCIATGNTMTGAENTAVSVYMGNVLAKDVSVGKLVFSYVAAFAVYVGQLSICVPVAVKMKKTVVVTAFGFFFGMLTALFSTLASKVEILDNIYRFTPYHYGVNKIGATADLKDMVMAVIVSLVFAGIMGLLSWLVFRRSDVK